MIKKHEKSGGVKEYDFLYFLLKLHEILPRDYIFVMDNAKSHRTKMVQEAVNGMFEDGRVVIYTAKYSPEYNPIEYVFGNLKRRLKSIPKVPQNLFLAVQNLCLGIDANMCRNTINKVFSRVFV